MSSSSSYQAASFLINFSNGKRQVVENQRRNDNIKFRKNSILELLVLQYIPILATSTLLAPLNRLKVLLQCQDILKNSTSSVSQLIKEIQHDKGLKGLWIGNYFFSIRIIVQTTLQSVLFDRIKYKQSKFYENYSDKKIHIPQYYLLSTIFTSFLTSAISFLFTYPIDLAYGRAATCLGNKTFTNIGDTFSSKTDEPKFFKYYNGATYALTHSLIYSTITFSGYQLLFNYMNVSGNNTLFSFMSTSLISLLASIAAYPFDTAKRRYQVLSIVDVNVSESVVYKGKYSGFGMHLARNIPFAFIQYQIFALACKLLRNNSL